MKLEYYSPITPHLKPSFTSFTQHNIPNPQQSTTYPQTKPLNLAISLSFCLSISLSPSHFASQSRDLPLNIAIILQRLINSPSQSRDLPRSPSPSRSRSPSRAVAHGLGLPLTRYVSLLSLHVQLVGIFVCKFYDFYAYFDSGF